MTRGGANGAALNKKSNKPKYSRFTQQELPSSRPVLTPGLVIMTYFSVGVAFVGIGIALLLMSGQVVEIVRRYDDFCIPPEYHERELDYITNNTTPKSCLINITVPKFMMKPIFVYYEIENFYQNHRRYVKSRSDKQLQSKAYEQETKECKTEADTNFSETVPCGLVAWSLFNDTYRFTLDEKSVPVNKSGISWSSDRKHKFGSDVFPKNFQNGSFIGGGKLNKSIPLSKQEDLIVWMRIAALPTFRKMYGRIEVDIQANKTLTVVIRNNYNTYAFSGKKKLVLSTAGLMGGKNDFMGVAYVVVGAICLFLGITYTVLHLLMPLPHKDQSPRAAVN